MSWLLILVLVGVLFWINYCDGLISCSSLSSIVGLGPASFKSNSSDFWFAMFTESIIVLVTFSAVILFIRRREEKNRKPIYRQACVDASLIYDEMYKLIYRIMAYKLNTAMLEPYKDWSDPCKKIGDEKVAYRIVKCFFEDMYASDIMVNRKGLESKTIVINRKELEDEIDYIYSETENYLQRFGAFLISEATGNEGSELQKYLNNTRGFFRKLKRSIDSHRSDNLLFRIRKGKETEYALYLGNDPEGNDRERIDVPPEIIKNMKNHCSEKMENCHPELIGFLEKSNVTLSLEFDKIRYLMKELCRVKASDNTDRDDCILTWTVLFGLFEKFRKSDKLSGVSETAFGSAELDFWCMYWDYRHRHLEVVKTKCKKNTLDFCLDNPQDSQSGPKDLAKAVREERERQCRLPQSGQGQDCGQAISELKEVFTVLNVRKNDEKAIKVFDALLSHKVCGKEDLNRPMIL